MNMKIQKHNQDNYFVESDAADAGTEKAYEKPVLIAYGDVRDITLGPTLGEGESGCAFFQQSGPGGCP
jgi:hypothetical protein